MARPNKGLLIATRLILALAAIGGSLVPGGCLTTRPVATRPLPVRLAVGYAGPDQNETVGLRVLGSLIISERLVSLGRDGRIEPSVAERWEQSADGLTWRFILRPALTFHDGSPLVASAVADRLRASCSAPLVGACRDIVSIGTDGPGVVVVQLREPSALLLDALAAMTLFRDSGRRVSAGAFREAPNSRGYAYEAFSEHYRGRSAIDRIELKLFPSARNAWAAMMRNEIDMVYEVPPDAVEFIEQSSSAQVRSFLRPNPYTMLLNTRRPGLAQRDLRRALNLAVNRTEIIARIVRGRGYPATDHVWPRHWAYRHDLPRFRYDPVEAVRLLEGLGLKMSASTTSPGIPSRFRFTCLIPENDARFERTGLLLQRQFTEIGIDMKIEPVSAQALGTRARSGDFDAFLVDLSASAGLHWQYVLWHSPDGTDPAAVVNHGYRAADGALDRLLRARTEEDMRGAVQALQRVMRDDPPAVFVLWTETARAVSARFRLPILPDRDVFTTVQQWQVASPPSAP